MQIHLRKFIFIIMLSIAFTNISAEEHIDLKVSKAIENEQDANNRKANLLYLILKHNEIQRTRFFLQFEDDTLKVGILGKNDVFYSSLKKLLDFNNTKEFSPHYSTINYMDSIDQLEGLHILYVDEFSPIPLEEVNKAIEGKPILLFTDVCYPVDQSIISFLIYKSDLEDKLWYAINIDRLRAAGIRLGETTVGNNYWHIGDTSAIYEPKSIKRVYQKKEDIPKKIDKDLGDNYEDGFNSVNSWGQRLKWDKSLRAGGVMVVGFLLFIYWFSQTYGLRRTWNKVTGGRKVSGRKKEKRESKAKEEPKAKETHVDPVDTLIKFESMDWVEKDKRRKKRIKREKRIKKRVNKKKRTWTP